MEALGGLLLLGSIALVIWLIAATARQMAKRKELMARYGDARIVDAIMARKIWEGMTEQQLVESWGHAADTDEKYLKSKTRRTYKYNQTGRNRYASRVFVENGYVVGW